MKVPTNRDKNDSEVSFQWDQYKNHSSDRNCITEPDCLLDLGRNITPVGLHVIYMLWGKHRIEVDHLLKHANKRSGAPLEDVPLKNVHLKDVPLENVPAYENSCLVSTALPLIQCHHVMSKIIHLL